MDVPAPAGGTVKEVKVKVGDKLSEGSLVLLLDTGGGAGAPKRRAAAAKPPVVSPPPRRRCTRPAASPKCACPTSATSRTCRSSR